MIEEQWNGTVTGKKQMKAAVCVLHFVQQMNFKKERREERKGIDYIGNVKAKKKKKQKLPPSPHK